MREIRLYGELGRRFGRVHRYDVSSPGEALRALRANHGREWERFLFEQRDAPFRIMLDDDAIDLERMMQPMGPEVLKIIPVVAGGKNAMWGIVIGVALIALSGPIGAGVGAVLGFGGATATSIVAMAGIGLTLAGVSNLLFKPPSAQTSEKANNLPSYSFDNGAVNTVGQGNPVPVGYGRVICGSQTVSMGLFAEDI